eukprot:TRINITY_DN66705_c2_g5_i1.p1 TRINITY_DN66705_c2_g5~~TRINITY_DN66705_c2_g5_i1.p1  ORF type:complete len:548 (+),score=251.51 TRINITY_DN66705_c2_g5_i1:516-2159(+)
MSSKQQKQKKKRRKKKKSSKRKRALAHFVPPNNAANACPVCFKFMAAPTQTLCCGTRFCAGCMRLLLLRSRNVCPFCTVQRPPGHAMAARTLTTVAPPAPGVAPAELNAFLQSLAFNPPKRDRGQPHQQPDPMEMYLLAHTETNSRRRKGRGKRRGKNKGKGKGKDSDDSDKNKDKDKDKNKNNDKGEDKDKGEGRGDGKSAAGPEDHSIDGRIRALQQSMIQSQQGTNLKNQYKRGIRYFPKAKSERTPLVSNGMPPIPTNTEAGTGVVPMAMMPMPHQAMNLQQVPMLQSAQRRRTRSSSSSASANTQQQQQQQSHRRRMQAKPEPGALLTHPMIPGAFMDNFMLPDVMIRRPLSADVRKRMQQAMLQTANVKGHTTAVAAALRRSGMRITVPAKEMMFHCDFDGCTKAFGKPSALKRHKRTHTGEKPFKCPFAGCTRAFADRTNVNRHILTHTGERPFKCTVAGCPKAFSRRCYMVRHLVNFHNLDPPPKPSRTRRGQRQPTAAEIVRASMIATGMPEALTFVNDIGSAAPSRRRSRPSSSPSS